MAFVLEQQQLSCSLIGTGRVASQLARALGQIEAVHLQQIYGRQYTAAQRCTQQTSVQAQAIDQLSQLDKVDVLIIAVSDHAIATVAQQLAALNYQGLVVHTSGSMPMQLLADYGLSAGVFYPLQTFSMDNVIDWHRVPIFIEALQQTHLAMLKQLSEQLSSKIYAYSSAQRLQLHLAAVFACNFSNYCFDIASQIMQAAQLDTQLLLPLIDETVAKLSLNSAFANQTGPAVRQDHNTLAQHTQLLSQQPEWQKIYQLLSHAIIQRHHTD